jgi:hypothetical protein
LLLLYFLFKSVVLSILAKLLRSMLGKSNALVLIVLLSSNTFILLSVIVKLYTSKFVSILNLMLFVV